MKLLELMILDPSTARNNYPAWNYAHIDVERIIAVLQDSQQFDGATSCELLLDCGKILVPRKSKKQMLEILDNFTKETKS